MQRSENVIVLIKEYFYQLFFGAHLKVFFACVGSMFTSEFFGTEFLVIIYLLFMALDFILSVVRSLVFGVYSLRYVNQWVIKFFAHAVTVIIMIGLIIATKAAIPTSFDIEAFIEFESMQGIIAIFKEMRAVDIIWGVLILNEAVSIFDTAVKLGMPVPRVFILLLRAMRRNTEKVVEKYIGGKE